LILHLAPWVVALLAVAIVEQGYFGSVFPKIGQAMILANSGDRLLDLRQGDCCYCSLQVAAYRQPRA
jgi:hypothetical protein